MPKRKFKPMTQSDLSLVESPPPGPDDGDDDEAEEARSVSASVKRKPKPLMRSPVRRHQNLQWTRAR
jgi:hypothetical protein